MQRVMCHPPAIPRSSLLAAVVIFTTVLIMLTPLRRSQQAGASREAGWLPLVVGSDSLIDNGAFHSLEHAASRHQASMTPQLRRQNAPGAPLP